MLTQGREWRRSRLAAAVSRGGETLTNSEPTAAAIGGGAGPGWVPGGAMDRFIDSIELIAAFFVGLVAADTFISVLLRYLFSISIPELV